MSEEEYYNPPTRELKMCIILMLAMIFIGLILVLTGLYFGAILMVMSGIIEITLVSILRERNPNIKR